MKKLLSVLLVVALVFSTMLSLTQLVSADGGDPVITQVCKQGNSAVSYSGFNWNGLGENLIPDPTVSHFDVGGAYGRYAKFDSNYNPVEVNPYYWWDKYVDCEEGFKKHYKYLSDNNYYDMSTLAVDGNGYRALTPGYVYSKQGSPSYQYIYRSPLNYADAVTKGQYASLTDDGSGVIRYSTGGGWRYMPLPAMKADTYYVIKFKMKYANGYTKLGILLNPTVDSLLGFDSDSNNCGKIGQSDNGDTAAFVLYTGANSYTDPCIAVYLGGSIPFYADDFGMYEVSADYAQEQSEGVRLTDSPSEPVTESTAFQVSREGANGSGSTIDYSDYDWSALGENLVPDPTVSHFDIDGVYGRYAKINSYYEPVDVNTYYWWDKYVNVNNGFIRYYKDLAEHGQFNLAELPQDGNGYYLLEDGKSYGAPEKHDGSYLQGDVKYDPIMRSLLNIANGVTKGQYASLTDDGSGVLRHSSASSYRGIPLPQMEANKYYVVKFNMKSVNANNTAIELCFEYDGSNILGPTASSISLGSTFANDTVDTACFVIYTGSNTYTDPFIKFFCQAETFFDDFGMYEVTEEFAGLCSVGTKLYEEPEEVIESEAFQVSRSGANGDGSAISYSGFNWDGFGENLVPDPTVSHFDEDGKYGRYAKLDSNYKSVSVNRYYWWDKAADFENGFTKYYKDLEEHSQFSLSSLSQDADGYYELENGKSYGTPEKHDGAYLQGGVKYDPLWRSPLNFTDGVTKGKYDSLTDDGTGVLRFQSGGAHRYIPLPAMEANKYYIIKFNVKSSGTNGGAIDLYLEKGPIADGNENCRIAMGEGFASGIVDTVCFIIYTGSKSYNSPFIKPYVNSELFFDDFGMYEVSEEYASAQAIGTKLTVGIPGECVPGDINGDLDVDNKDLLRLFQYLTGWNVEVNEDVLDVNGDDNVNNKDFTRLFQSLSNIDVQIFGKKAISNNGLDIG